MFGIYDNLLNQFVEDYRFDVWSDAVAFANNYSDELGVQRGARFAPRKMQAYVDPDEWRRREQSRFASGEYTPVPWVGLPWFNTNKIVDHYVHVSKDGRKVAYTQSVEHGQADRQTVISVGTYLTRHFGSVLTVAQINDYARRFSGGVSALDEHEIVITNDPDEIVRIYEIGPHSCVNEFDIAPSCAVYGGPGASTALAYLPVFDKDRRDGLFGDYSAEERVDARTIVWPEKKIYARIYPTSESSYFSKHYTTLDKADYARDAAEALRVALERQGYRRSVDFSGAHLRAILASNGDGWLMPYLDTVPSTVTLVDGNRFIIERNGDYDATNYEEGRIGNVEDDDDLMICDNCDARVDEPSTVYVGRHIEQQWCEHCVDMHTFICETTDHICSETHLDSHTAVDTDETICLEFLDEGCDYFECAVTGGIYRRARSGRTVILRNGTTAWWCKDEVDVGTFVDAVDGEIYAREGHIVVSLPEWAEDLFYSQETTLENYNECVQAKLIEHDERLLPFARSIYAFPPALAAVAA